MSIKYEIQSIKNIKVLVRNRNFGLRQSAALKCLKHFTEIGILKKEGARNSPVYFLNK